MNQEIGKKGEIEIDLLKKQIKVAKEALREATQQAKTLENELLIQVLIPASKLIFSRVNILKMN